MRQPGAVRPLVGTDEVLSTGKKQFSTDSIEAHLIRDFQAYVHMEQAPVVAGWDGVNREELSRLLDIAVNRGIEDILNQSQQLGENPPTQPQNPGTEVPSDHDPQLLARPGAGTSPDYEDTNTRLRPQEISPLRFPIPHPATLPVSAPQVSADLYRQQIQEPQVRGQTGEGIMDPLSSQVYHSSGMPQEQNDSKHPPSQNTSFDERNQSADRTGATSDTPSIQGLQHQNGIQCPQCMNMPKSSL
jgi:hypothetical protein